MAKREQKITKRLRSSYMSSIISTSLVLFLLGVTGVFMLNASHITEYFRENFTLSLIVKNNVNDAGIIKLGQKLQEQPYVRECRTITKEEAAHEMEEELGKDFTSFLNYNPLPVTIEVKLNAEYTKSDSITMVREKLSNFSEVDEIIYKKSLIEAVNENLHKFGIIALLFIGLMLFVSLVLINNTIRLSVYSKRFVIHAMKLVGANKSFIRRPFLSSSIWQGLTSSIIAICLMATVTYLMQKDLKDFFVLTDAAFFAYIFGAIILLGISINLISTYFTVSKFLRLNADELYY